MKYNPKFFKESMPEWKRKKDPILTKIFYRPVSFVVASILAEFDISANDVSYFSTIVGIIASVCFLIPTFKIQLIGAILVNIWLVLDCVDGNLARSIKKQPFGEFADGISSYILVGFICTCIGVSVYYNGGVFIPEGYFISIIIGAIASSSDSLMRLIYQKYKNTERDLADKGIIKIETDNRTDHSKVGSIRVRIESELGIGGLLPIFILLGILFNFLDLVLIYSFLYYFLSFVLVSLLYIRKAIKKQKI